MKIENPTEQDVRDLIPGQEIKVNGKAFKVEGVARYSAVIVGPRGGEAYLVPTVCGKAVTITRPMATSRDAHVATLEVA